MYNSAGYQRTFMHSFLLYIDKAYSYTRILHWKVLNLTDVCSLKPPLKILIAQGPTVVFTGLGLGPSMQAVWA